MIGLMKKFREETSGNVAMLFALSLLPVVGAAGAAVDYHRAESVRGRMQAAADIAALGTVLASLEGASQRQLYGTRLFDANDTSGIDPAVDVDGDSGDVTVTATAELPTTLMNAFGIPTFALEVTATAQRDMTGPPPCILGLNAKVSGAVTISGNADMLAKDCVVHSNSSDASAMRVQGSPSVEADGFCSVGGVQTNLTLDPKPRENCRPIQDPFAKLAMPEAAAKCTASNVSVSPKKSAVFTEGTYCGGMDLKGDVTFQPGVYVIKDGGLKINSQATVSGTGVVFYFTGSNAGFDINGGGDITLKAPVDGPYGGMLFMQDRDANAGAENKINGNSGSTFVGAVYAPTQQVTVNGSGSFGQSSPYMPIVADQVTISGNAKIRIDQSGMDLAAELPKTEGGVRLTH